MLARVRTHTRLAATALAAGTAFGTIAIAGPAAAKPGGVPAIPLNTEQETTGSNTGASGFFSYTVQAGELCYTVTVRNLSAVAVAAHIHKAPRHVAGPIVIPLEVPSKSHFTESGCVIPEASLLADLVANPKAYYVNVHTSTFPGGEVRGQLK
jgi:hypothetical protein